jgi:hypothetical protein
MVHTENRQFRLKLGRLDQVAKPLTGLIATGDCAAIYNQLADIHMSVTELLNYAQDADLGYEIEPYQQYVLINVQNMLEEASETCLGSTDIDIHPQIKGIMSKVNNVLGLMLIYV